MHARSSSLLAVPAMLLLAAGCASVHAGLRASASSLSPSGALRTWTMYQGSPAHNAVFSENPMRAAWSYDAGAKINGGLALSGRTLILDDFAGDVIALDAQRGAVRWRAHVPNVAMSTPIVAGGDVFVGTGKSGVLEQTTLLQHFGVRGQPIWGVPQGDRVVALDAKTGAQRWAFTTAGEDMPSPVYYDGELIFANGDRHAYALDAATGARRWSADIGGISTMASAMIADGAAIVTACADGIRSSSAIALDPATGRAIWRSPYGHCDGSPAFGSDRIFVASVAPGKQKYVGSTVVAALDPKNGAALWTYRSKSAGVWSILASDESAIAGTYDAGTYYQPAPLDDEIIAFDARSGRVRWRFRTTGPVKMSPVIANGRLYAGDTVGLLYTIDAASGELIQARPFSKPFGTSPPIVDGRTLFIANGTSLLALPL